jgi:hypothetical protein
MAWSGLYNLLQKTQGEGESFMAVEREEAAMAKIKTDPETRQTREGLKSSLLKDF